MTFSINDVILVFMIRIDATNAAKLTDAIIDIISRDGCEAISYVKDSLYDRGWHNLGNNSDFERLVRNLGFTIRTGYNDRNQERQEIALETEAETKARIERERQLDKVYRDTYNATLATSRSPEAPAGNPSKARDAAKKACVKARKSL